MADDTKWTWDIDLKNLVGRDAYIETLDGMLREGRITGIRTQAVQLAGETVEVPLAIELNGDPRDLLEFLRLKSVEIR